jgi:response regulator RpfG family c-di-GMP phosphodiesterase
MTGFKSIYALIDFLKENRPDLILLGDVVEGLGCSEAIALLRQTMKKDDEIPILLMADKGAQNPALGGHSEVVRGVVTKPLDQAELLERVRKILTLQEPSDQHEIPMIRNTIDDIASTLDECNDASNGIWMGKEAFENAYRHMLRNLERYQGIAFQVLFTVEMSRNTPEPQRAEILRRFRVLLQGTLQSSDMMMERGENQFFLLLPEVEESDIGHVISGVISQWKMTEYGDSTDIASEVRRAKLIADETSNSIRNRVDWVVVVDDDVTNLKMAGHILSKQQMRVTALKSGRALLDYVRSHKPDLILLDVRMPEMDGFETLELLKQQMAPGQEIPVIFLTSVDNAEYEMKGLELGAMDFIKKPFVPGVLISRVKHIIQLVRLQKNLSDEVEIKTQENENLSLRIVQTLADAIDAKDTYTNGHSGRVAEYAREIARRYGYTRKQQDEIFMMGLLHDVGKIGVPDSVINKPSKLTEAEYAQIKTHSVMGERILRNIRERPKLAIAARWHHERYDGRGYPDGLSGESIPEEARIIAVADAYDAMTSRRSYRDILPQANVKREIEIGRGTQFDPQFAEIMLQIIAEDTEYHLREN